MRGRQRTVATHVLGALQFVSRLEHVAETLRAALNQVATAAPAWLREHTPPEWYARYGRRSEEDRLPKGKAARQTCAAVVEADGLRFLDTLLAPTAPPKLRHLPAVGVLRCTWIEQYVVIEEQVRLRAPKEMPSATAELESPSDAEARYATKRGMRWVG